jgi:surface antigen
MQKYIKLGLKIIPIMLTISLTACSGYPMLNSNPGYVSAGTHENELVGSSVDQNGNERNVNVTMTGGGDIGLRSMTANDKAKLARALDAGTGRSTRWRNSITGITYSVTPTKKVEIKGNPFCREYNIIATKGANSKSINDTACITTDGSWHSV